MLKTIIQRPIGASFIALAFLVLGIISFTQLPQNLMPEIQQPTIVVRVEHPGATEQEIEKEIVDELEDKFSAVTGLIGTESIIQPEKAELLLHFRTDINIDETVDKLREKMSSQRFSLNSTPPKVLRYDPDAEPVMKFVILPETESDLVTISEQYRDKLIPRLETLSEVASVRLRGQKNMILQVTPDEKKMLSYGIEINELKNLINDGIKKSPLNRISTLDGMRSLEIIGSAAKPEDLASLSLRPGIHVGDIARIELTIEEPEEMVFYKSHNESSGREALILEIMSHREVGMVPMSVMVKKTLDLFAKASEENPDTQWNLYGAQIKLISDSSEPVKETIDEVSLAVLVGAGLALVVLFLFMRSFRSSIIIFISVPLSTVICFLFMAKWEVGLNLMSLSGLALGIGMLVDNAIVVLESINRKREEGHSILESSYLGSREVIPAVIASTLTTVAVFFPLTFLEGNLGDLLFDQAFTVSTSLIISLFVAVLLVPTFMAIPKLSHIGNSSQTEAQVELSSGIYERLIDRLISRPIISIVLLIGLFAIIYICLQVLPYSSMPQIPIQRVKADIQLKSDLTIEDSHTWVKNFMNDLKLEGPGFKTLSISGEATQYARIYGNRDSNEIQLSIEFDEPFFDFSHLRTWMSEFERWVYLKGASGVTLKDIPAIDLGLGENNDCEVILVNSGDVDYRMLQNEFTDFLRQKGALGIQSSSAAQKNEVLILPDSLKLKEVNISLNNFNQRLKTALEKSQINGFFPEYDGIESANMLKIIIEREKRNSSIKEFEAINIGSAKRPVYLGDVATVQNSLESKHIYHLDGRNVLRIQCQTLPKGLDLNDLSSWFEKQKEFYPSLEYEIRSGRSKMSGSLEAMLHLFALSIFLIVVIMAVQFESVLQPFLVIFSIPMALAGSLVLLWLSSNGINIMSGIGIVILIGVAVNNAIVLVSTANQKLAIETDRKRAIILAAKTRLRPIIMTAFTTITGLLPLLWGSSASSVLKVPLAVAVIGGLFSSTVLVLFILPSIMYSLTRNKQSQ